MLENFKKFPVVTRVIFCLQLLSCISSMLDAINFLKVTSEISMIYMLAGGDAPSKFTLYMTIMSNLLIISSIVIIFLNPNKQTILVYFGVLIFNLVISLSLKKLDSFFVVTSIVLPLIMTCMLTENKYLFRS